MYTFILTTSRPEDNNKKVNRVKPKVYRSQYSPSNCEYGGRQFYILLIIVICCPLVSVVFPLGCFYFSLFALSCPIRLHCFLRFMPGHMRRIQHEMDGKAQEQSKESQFSTWDRVWVFSSHCVCGIWVYLLSFAAKQRFCCSASKQLWIQTANPDLNL